MESNSNSHNSLTALLEEQKYLREEVILLTRGFIKTFFTILTVVLAIIGIYWEKRIFPDDTIRSNILFGFSQIVVFIFLFGLRLFFSLNVHSAYLEVLEENIAKISGSRLSCWERYCAPRYLYSFSSPFLWSSIIMVTMFALLFFGCLALGFKQLNNFFFGAVITIECVILIIIAIVAGRSRRRIVRDIKSFVV